MFRFCRNNKILNSIFPRKYSFQTQFLGSEVAVPSLECYEVCIIGGGIIGTAIAREITGKSKCTKSILIEKEDGLGKHQSSHNSGVIHSGVYYKPDSLKAKFSKRGIKLIMKYCVDNQICYKTLGKLIVATDACQLNDLRALHDRGMANQVEELEMLWTRDKIRAIEPHCNGIQALWCPKVANVDWSVVTKSFGRDYERNGGQVLLNNEVKHISDSNDVVYPISLETKEGYFLKTKYLILCGGLQSEVLSHIVDAESSESTILMSLTVDYQLLRNHSITTNIYGVPDLQVPFLGVHITPRLDGNLLLGPNAIPAFKIEGYRSDEIDITYLKKTISSSSFQNMTKRYLRQCFNQVKKSLWPQFQNDELQSLANINVADIDKGPSAVQTQLINSDGSFVEDFVIEYFKGCGIRSRMINCKFLPSPAATCSLAIAEDVADNFFRRYHNDVNIN